MPKIPLAAPVASGSYACTAAPADRSALISGMAGASRMSSVRGLNASPHTAIVLPFRDPKCFRIFVEQPRLLAVVDLLDGVAES